MGIFFTHRDASPPTPQAGLCRALHSGVGRTKLIVQVDQTNRSPKDWRVAHVPGNTRKSAGGF
jgi:hypothetical protein